MIEVKSRSPEAWGPLASMGEREFKSLVNNRRDPTKDLIKTHIKKVKKLRTYKVTFKKEWHSDTFEIQAENDWDVGSAARAYFKKNADSIGFKEKPRGKWAGDYEGYDSISYVKVRS